MEFAAGVLALIRRDLSFTEYTGEFCGLVASTELHDAPMLHLFRDAPMLHLFRLGANYHCPMDLPDTTGLCWREGIYRCLGSFRSRVETSLRVSPLAHLHLRWSRPAHLRRRWSHPAHLHRCCSCPAYLRLRWHCPAQRFPSALQCLLLISALQCLLLYESL